MLITISDNGSGIEEDALIALNRRLQPGIPDGVLDKAHHGRAGGVALTNIAKRIQILFGEHYGLCVYSTPNAGTDIELYLPVQDRTDREHEAGNSPNSSDR